MNFDTLRRLKYVLAAAELGSMRKVALGMQVRESTVSRNISAVEQQLDLQFFERRHNGVHLTMEGRNWIEGVRDHYEMLEEALAQTSRRNRDGERLRIGLSAPFGRAFLVDLIDRFERTYPDIVISLEDGSCRNHVSAVRRRSLDIAFMCACCETRGCRTETICEERVMALLPDAHPLANKAVISWTDLSGERLLVPQGSDGPLLDPCLTKRIATGANMPEIEHCQACQATVIMKVQIGRGFTITGASFADNVAISGTVWRPIAQSETMGVVKAVWLVSNPKRAALRLLAMTDSLVSEMKPWAI